MLTILTSIYEYLKNATKKEEFTEFYALVNSSFHLIEQQAV